MKSRSSLPTFAMILLALPTWLGAAHASAQTPVVTPPVSARDNLDEVRLKDGGMVRGTLAEVTPGKSLAIVVLGSGERRVIDWDAVENPDALLKSQNAEAVPQPPTPSIETLPAPAAVPAQLALQPQVLSSGPVTISMWLNGQPVQPTPLNLAEPGVLKLHMNADNKHLELRRILGVRATGISVVGGRASTSYSTIYQTVCRAPCDQVIDASDGASYYFDGPRIAPSKRFQLANQHGEVAVDVRAGNSRRHQWGAGLCSYLAPAMLLSGVTNSAIGFAMDTPGYKIAGGALLGAGIIHLAVGIYMLRHNRTHFEFTHG